MKTIVGKDPTGRRWTMRDNLTTGRTDIHREGEFIFSGPPHMTRNTAKTRYGVAWRTSACEPELPALVGEE